jgi:hypothetical protein
VTNEGAAPPQGRDEPLAERAEHESRHGAREGDAHGDAPAPAVAVREEGGLCRQPGEAQAYAAAHPHGSDHDAEGGGVRAEEDAARGRPQTRHHHQPGIAPRNEPAGHRAEGGRDEPDE